MTRAQMAIFLILGLIVVGTFTILIIFSQQNAINMMRQNAIQKSAIENQMLNIQANVESCLKIGAEEALRIAGAQGGFIFKEQGGVADESKIRRHDGSEVFWMLRNTEDQPPAYPRSESMIGKLQIPKLDSSSELSPSIAEMLAEYALYRTKECIDLQNYEKYGLKVSAEASDMKVTIGDSDTIFELYLPLSVQVNKTAVKLKKSEYKYISPVRIGREYQSALRFVLNDLKLDFMAFEDVLNKPTYNLLYPYGGFVIKRGIEFDTIEVRDNKTGHTFRILRENRNPVLKNIPSPLEFNISDEIDFTRYAVDPDEDQLNITVDIYNMTLDSSNNIKWIFHKRKVNSFNASTGDIGVHMLNVTAIDPQDLKDWQEGIRIRVMCEYSSQTPELETRNHEYIGVYLPDSNVLFKIGSKKFSYNPSCCNETTRISFKKGFRAKYIENGITVDCECDENGNCQKVNTNQEIPPDEPPMPPTQCKKGEVLCGGSCCAGICCNDECFKVGPNSTTSCDLG